MYNVDVRLAVKCASSWNVQERTRIVTISNEFMHTSTTTKKRFAITKHSAVQLVYWIYMTMYCVMNCLK